MKIDSRVFLLHAGELRAFWWFMMSVDYSIYFGSSNARYFRTGRTGIVRTSETAGIPLDPEQDGRAPAAEELAGKLSVHGSGVVNLDTRTAGVRDRHTISAPRNGFVALPLVLVVPMRPDLYPVSKRNPRPADVVISADLDDPPFAVLFYLGQIGAAEPPAMASIRARCVGGHTLSRTFGMHALSAFKYHPRGYRSWLEKEGTIVASPQTEGADASWPLLD